MNKTLRKSVKAVVALLAVAFSQPATVNFANAVQPPPPPKPDAGAAAPAAGAGGTGDAGKGQQPDPATGKTFDFRKMVMDLLGLGDQATDEDVTSAFNSCMATEPAEEDKAIKGKLDEATAGKTAAEGDLAVAQKTASDHAAAAHSAVAKLAEATAQNEKLLKRAELAEGAFANERNAHIQSMCNGAVALGKLTKAEGEVKVKELANAKTPAEFEAGVALIANAKTKFQTGSQIGTLERTIAPGTASNEYLTMVNEAVKADPKHDFTWHWSNVGKTEKGKALLAGMKQPERNDDKFAAKK